MPAATVPANRLGELPDQGSVLSTAEAVRAFGRGVLRAQLKGNRWQRPHPRVVVLHNGPLTGRERCWVGLLACPPRSALGGLCALALEGFEGFAPVEPQVIVPEGSRRLDLPGVELHWSRELSDLDVHPLRQPRRTRMPRSLIDAASWCGWGTERRARAIIVAGVQQRLAPTRDLREALTRRGPCRHRALIVESILDAHGGIQSLPERDISLIIQRRRLPAPTRQCVLRRTDRRYYLDLEWREYETACEIHGIPHLAVMQWESDLERANEITIAGPRLLIFSSYAVRRQQDRVADQLERMLRRGGWHG